jgi:hypothetical protein
MKTRTQLNLNVLILNLHYRNYIFTTLQENKFTVVMGSMEICSLPIDELPDKQTFTVHGIMTQNTTIYISRTESVR